MGEGRGHYDRSLTKEQRAALKAKAAGKTAAPVKRAYHKKVAEPEKGEVKGTANPGVADQDMSFMGAYYPDSPRLALNLPVLSVIGSLRVAYTQPDSANTQIVAKLDKITTQFLDDYINATESTKVKVAKHKKEEKAEAEVALPPPIPGSQEVTAPASVPMPVIPFSTLSQQVPPIPGSNNQ